MMFSILQVLLMLFLQVNSGKHFINVCKHGVVIQGLVFHVSSHQTIIIIIAINTMYNACDAKPHQT